MIVVPGAAGEIGVLARHAPLDALELGPRLVELRLRPRVVDLGREDRVVDERDRPVELDLEEAGPGGVLAHVALVHVHARRSGLERRDERRVPGEDADLASRARHDDHLRVALEHGAVGRDEGHVEPTARHYAPTGSGSRSASSSPSGSGSSPPIRRPFSTAWSIVPTM